VISRRGDGRAAHCLRIDDFQMSRPLTPVMAPARMSAPNRRTGRPSPVDVLNGPRTHFEGARYWRGPAARQTW
jgi:hypothetical protein